MWHVNFRKKNTKHEQVERVCDWFIATSLLISRLSSTLILFPRHSPTTALVPLFELGPYFNTSRDLAGWHLPSCVSSACPRQVTRPIIGERTLTGPALVLNQTTPWNTNSSWISVFPCRLLISKPAISIVSTNVLPRTPAHKTISLADSIGGSRQNLWHGSTRDGHVVEWTEEYKLTSDCMSKQNHAWWWFQMARRT